MKVKWINIERAVFFLIGSMAQYADKIDDTWWAPIAAAVLYAMIFGWEKTPAPVVTQADLDKHAMDAS